MHSVLEMLRTCYHLGGEGTGMYPRGATAHGCSFAPVADFGYSKTSKLLESLMCDASEYLSQADTSCRPSKLCKRQFIFKQTVSFRDTTNLHSNTCFPAPSVLPTSACFRLAPISNNEKCQQAKPSGIFTHFIYISFPVEHKNYNRRTIHSHRSISLSRIFSF